LVQAARYDRPWELPGTSGPGRTLRPRFLIPARNRDTLAWVGRAKSAAGVLNGKRSPGLVREHRLLLSG